MFAQDVRQQSIDSAAVRYLQNADRQSTLYYGNEQDVLPHTIALASSTHNHHPYMKDMLYTKARLSYNGVIYPEALLRLDLSRDELITISLGFRNIVLFPENVDFVELHGKRIIYFSRDSLPGCPSSGYYFLLHSGKCRVLEKQTAALMFNSSTGETYYVFSTRFYLYKDSVYYSIKNQRGLLKALSPYKKELKRFISANNLLYRENAEEFIPRTVREYENLTGMQ